MIAIKHNTFKLDKPGWIVALTHAHINDRKENTIIVKTFQKTRKVN